MELATIFGIFGVIANTLWPLIKQRRFLLIGQIIACIFMAIHFALLNSLTGSIVMLVAATQAALAIPLESHPKFKRVYLLSLLLTPVACWLTWQGYPSIFSSLALMFFCIGNLQVNTKFLCFFLILCIFGWVGHNVLISSYPALGSNFLALCTSVYGFTREFMPNKQMLIGAKKRAWNAAKDAAPQI